MFEIQKNVEWYLEYLGVKIMIQKRRDPDDLTSEEKEYNRNCIMVMNMGRGGHIT